MPTIKRELDFELCRMILLRREELWDSGMTSLPAHYYFEGYGAEIISQNINKLFNAKPIFAKGSENWGRGQLSLWPTEFQENGWRFLAAAKDEKTWTEAIKTVTAQDSTYNLDALKSVLFAGMY